MLRNLLLIVLMLLPTMSRAQTPLNPLTGLPFDGPDQRPLIVKISNYPPDIRPLQAGLHDADIVWEHLLAGGVTRFSAVFYTNNPERIGPVRSARLIDFTLARVYSALFSYSGMADGTTEALFRDPYLTSLAVGGSGPCPPLCRFPREGLALEHTLYADANGVRELAVEREANIDPEPVRGMIFRPAPAATADPVASLVVRYRESVVKWTWEDGRWLRAQDGTPHVAEGRRVGAENVVVLEATHVEMPYVRDQYWGPPNWAFDVPLMGEGRALLLRDGTLVEGRWVRESQKAALQFETLDGAPLAFKPGQTFINLVPTWFDSYELEIVPPSPPTVTVSGETGVNMYYGPGDRYATPDVAYPLDTFAALGRDFASEWVQVKRGDSRAVWLPLDRLDAEGLEVASLPVPRSTLER